MIKTSRLIIFVLLTMLSASCESEKYRISEREGCNIVIQKNGATLGYNTSSGVRLIVDDGYAFKDLNRNGSLDIYEDWR